MQVRDVDDQCAAPLQFGQCRGAAKARSGVACNSVLLEVIGQIQVIAGAVAPECDGDVDRSRGNNLPDCSGERFPVKKSHDVDCPRLRWPLRACDLH